MTHEEILKELSTFSCGHGCIVAKASGMATNGGCRCLDDIPHERRRRLMQIFIMYRKLVALQ